MKLIVLLGVLLPLLLTNLGATGALGRSRDILIIAGPPSHGPGVHRFPAGAAVLAEALNRSGGPVQAEAVEGWPADPARVRSADLVVLYSDGLGGHVARGRAAELRARWQDGGALAVLHFALEPPEDEPALADLLLDAIGGRFEAGWSVNPVWRLRAALEPGHPAAAGVGALEVDDEWYFHLRFRPGINPLLAAHPPRMVVEQDGPRSGNADVRTALDRGEAQVVAWTWAPEGKPRGFGFTGGHSHRFWYQDDFRRLVVNGWLWAAGLEVPARGFAVVSPTAPLFATIDEAIARGDEADVRRHVAADPARVQGAKGARLTPLQQAILRKQTAIAQLLLAAGADVQAPDGSGRTPLHLAVERGDEEMVAELLARGADPARRDRPGGCSMPGLIPMCGASAAGRRCTRRRRAAGRSWCGCCWRAAPTRRWCPRPGSPRSTLPASSRTRRRSACWNRAEERLAPGRPVHLRNR